MPPAAGPAGRFSNLKHEVIIFGLEDPMTPVATGTAPTIQKRHFSVDRIELCEEGFGPILLAWPTGGIP